MKTLYLPLMALFVLLSPVHSPARQSKCKSAEVPGKKVVAKQTFEIDFAPFHQACFVTVSDPQFNDPGLDAEIHVFKDGKSIYQFENLFNGSSGCYVEAVSFKDMNGDGLQDVTVVGLCGAKEGPYPQNMIYINTGSAFKSYEKTNEQLSEFETLRAIENYVRKNRAKLFK